MRLRHNRGYLEFGTPRDRISDRREVGAVTAAEATHPGPIQLAATLADDLDSGMPVRAAEDAEDHA